MKYPTGTRFDNSITYDEATDEVVEGFQVFRQCRPDGTPTGRRSIVAHDSTGTPHLVAVTLAVDLRRRAIRDASHDLLAALREMLDYYVGDQLPPEPHGTVVRGARAAIAKAVGIV